MPLILRSPKADYCDWTGKRVIAIAGAIVEHNSYLTRVVMIFIHHHERPLSIWTKHRISSYEYVAFIVSDIAGGREQPVLCVLRFHPLLRD